LIILGQASIEVVLYLIDDDQKPAQKRHILRLNLHGKCAVNVVDNLILIHHQASKGTYIYDIEERSTAQNDGFQSIHQPLLSALPIQPVIINVQSLSPALLTSTSNIELYSSNWIVFLPNVIIDVKMGCLWYLSINLDYLLELVTDRLLLIDILLRRTNGKASIVALLRTLLTNIIAPVQIDCVNVSDIDASTALECWIQIIDRINRVYTENSSSRPLLDQVDISSVLNLFSTIISISSNNRNSTDYDRRSLSIVSSHNVLADEHEHRKAVKFAVGIIIEYIRSLNDHNIPVQYIIYELLVNLLMKTNQFFQLQQLIQYQVLNDSLPLGK
jgi:regulator of MON1-CCZ1 complex